MNVWVVYKVWWVGAFDRDFKVDKVFDNKEKANKYCKNKNDKNDDAFWHIVKRTVSK